MKIKRILSADPRSRHAPVLLHPDRICRKRDLHGSLNGYSYVCSASCRSDEAKANMSSRSSETLIISGPLKYVSTDGKSKVFQIWANSTKSVQSTNPGPVKYFVSLTARFKIGSVTVQTISVDA